MAIYNDDSTSELYATKRRAPAAPSEEASVLGAALSNTAPPNTTDIVNKHIDYLSLTYRGVLKPKWKERLDELKQVAISPSRKEKAHAQIMINDKLFMVHDKGSGLFKYIISGNGLNIRISTSKATSTVPLATVKFDNELLYQKEAHVLEAEADELIRVFGYVEGRATVSRCDICCDVVTSYPKSVFLCDDYIARSNNFNLRKKGKSLTGISYGIGGDIGFRLYDKIREIEERSKKYYFYDIWRAQGWDGCKDVWRCEFQLERNALRSFGITTVDDLCEKLAGLWAYCTDEWIRLPIPIENDHHTDRWETHPFWLEVQTAYDPYEGEPLKRDYEHGKKLSKEAMFNSYRSSITHFMAMEFEDEIEVAHLKILPAFKTHYNYQGFSKSFERDIEERVADKRRRHNIKLNSSRNWDDDWE